MQNYNNCFVLGGKSKTENGKLIKVPMYIDQNGEPRKLYGGKNSDLQHFYELSFEQANQTLHDYLNGTKRTKGDESLRVSIYLDNAMYGGLHLFVIDFDEYDEQSAFFKAAHQLADKVTRSQGGGYHMFYGVDRMAAAPLFDSINLLASKAAKGFISKTSCTTLDGTNKVDFFCDAPHFIYEWEPWDNTVGLTDRTQALYELIKANFELTRPTEFEFGEWEDADGVITLEGYSEGALYQKMDSKQQEVFDDLKTLSADCPANEWFRIGIDICHIFVRNWAEACSSGGANPVTATIRKAV